MCCALVARALLLLAASSGHSPAPGGEEMLREFTFVVEHKTGTQFGRCVGECFAPRDSHQHRTLEEWSELVSSKYNRNYSFPEEWGRIVYMVRHAYAMATSNYFYSMGCQSRTQCLRAEEPLHRRVKETMWWVGNVIKRPLAQYIERPLPNETFNAYIHRVPKADAIMATMISGYGAIMRSNRNLESYASQDRVLVVCLGDVFAAFDKTMQTILQHIRVPANRVQRACLKACDPIEHYFVHGTRQVDHNVRKEVMAIVKEHDAKYLGGVFGMSTMTEGCKAEVEAG